MNMFMRVEVKPSSSRAVVDWADPSLLHKSCGRHFKRTSWAKPIRLIMEQLFRGITKYVHIALWLMC